MPFYIRVPSLITPVHCITQTEEPSVISIQYSGDYFYLFSPRNAHEVVSPALISPGEHLTYAMSINTYSSQKLENLQLDHKEK
jgi:hypothetical protein